MLSFMRNLLPTSSNLKKEAIFLRNTVSHLPGCSTSYGKTIMFVSDSSWRLNSSRPVVPKMCSADPRLIPRGSVDTFL